MAELLVPEPLASRLREIAQRENRALETVLERMISEYEFKQVMADLRSPPPPEIPDYPPRPASSLTNDDIEVPDDIDDKEAYREAARALAPKLYEIAREYWQETGNTERLALTDEELDKVFWLIDHEGIPRFKSEREAVHLPPDPLKALVGLIDTDQVDLSTTVNESIADYFGKKHGSSD